MVDAIPTAASPVSKFRSPATVAVDNLLRKTLRVSDPRDPDQIANALLNFYPEEADRDRREQAGLPYSSVPDYVPVAKNNGPSSVELAQAQDDLERDLQTLSTSSPLKDIRIEMIGWGRSIRQIANDGLAAARLALDSVNHDRAMSARRQLGEYSRLARYVGTLTDGSAILFRRFAQSCDVLAALILVAIGEGLASSGITRSTAIVRSAAGELQARRNAVIMALRSLTGSVESSLGQEDWPRGIEAYRSLVRQLEAGGQADLRALLEESALSKAMDDLVDLSTGASVEGLRELSTASSLLVHRFQRLIQFGQSIQVPIDEPITLGSPESPPLVAFVSSLQLFVDAFVSQGSSRLLYVARPPIIVYGLYGAGGPDLGAQRLIGLTMARSFLLEQVDCFAGCGCEDDNVKCQILLDYILFLVDRAIDLYSVGTDPDGRGEQERRATAVGLAINEVLVLTDPGKAPPELLCEFSKKLRDMLDGIAEGLLEPFGGRKPAAWSVGLKSLMVRELRIAYQAEDQTERLVRSLTQQCDFDVFNFKKNRSLIRWMIREVLHNTFNVRATMPNPVQMPSPVASSMASMGQNRPDYWSA
ncbi:hypothetical protein SAMN03159463_02317 [Mesorhizobium sp. NFR06]|uniref:hypothetical protein n=1 Tax=Mesorhizobium sp. NFR06 TaxID=1566290 RepID=UPI0008DFFC0D|nr:hypothetical protein [Mesorhizobium sp. NFR06]SFO57376.1 hypothetical protein SAMN03159463_02317 [Mesorhizobium sp. NFR06]